MKHMAVAVAFWKARVARSKRHCGRGSMPDGG